MRNMPWLAWYIFHYKIIVKKPTRPAMYIYSYPGSPECQCRRSSVSFSFSLALFRKVVYIPFHRLYSAQIIPQTVYRV
jgi:hypothetical protein